MDPQKHSRRGPGEVPGGSWGTPGGPWGPLGVPRGSLGGPWGFQKCKFSGSYHDRTPKSIPGGALGRSRGVPGGSLGNSGGPWGSRGGPWGVLGGSKNVNFAGPIMIGPPKALPGGTWGGSNMKLYCSNMKSYCSEFINLISPSLLSPKGWPYCIIL